MATVSIKDDEITVAQAAEIIGVTAGRIWQLIDDSTLKARMLHGKAWLVNRKSAEEYAVRDRTTGRPRTGDKKSSRSA